MDAVLLGIRPEHLALAAPGQGQIQVAVELIEQMGAQSLLICSAGGTRLRALINRDDRIRRGDRVGLAVEPRNLHLFNAKTGDALRRDTPAPYPNQQAQGGLS